ncbi:unnamed protein product [Caenorhabditis angaria]|uniref:Uncharacterized protein n=1 Tax=Caenorhabditis angaria TaxID=860376 RepID=A0A9P1N0G8_9PELO|nr:unnamed protein product [Caenorhabditis angaria]
MELTFDTLDCILRECNLQTIDKILAMNKMLRNQIQKHRRHYARLPVKIVKIEPDVSCSCYRWTIELRQDCYKFVNVPPHQIDRINLSQFAPRIFIFSCFSRNDPMCYDKIFNEIPKEWFREIKHVEIQSDENEKTKSFQNEKLELFEPLSSLRIEGFVAFSKIGEILKLMQNIEYLAILPQNENEIETNEDDINYIIEEAKNLSFLDLRNIKHIYSSEKLIDFLKNASFADSTVLNFEEWPTNGEMIYRFLKEETEIQESCYLPISMFHEDAPPILPHRYSFKFRNTLFMITFWKDQIINDPRLLR